MKEFVLEALKPAKVKSVTLDEAKKAIQIKVDEDQLSLAIGKRGQNARLTSRLTGWDINIEKDKIRQGSCSNTNVTRGVQTSGRHAAGVGRPRTPACQRAA